MLGNILSMHGNQELATAAVVFFGTFSVPFCTQSLVSPGTKAWSRKEQPPSHRWMLMSALTVFGVGAVLLVPVLLGVPILTYFEMQKEGASLVATVVAFHRRLFTTPYQLAGV